VTTHKANGFALLDLIFVIGIITILASIATPRLLAARQSAGAASAIGSLRAINSAQLTFALTCGGGFYAPDLPALGVAPPRSPEAFLSQNLTLGNIVTRGGYIIQMHATPYALAPASCNGVPAGGAGTAFKAAGDPANPAENFRYFATNANAQLWEDTNSMFAVMPEAGDPPTGHVLR
jgi:type II secretory pathway pseudopilin PulG